MDNRSIYYNAFLNIPAECTLYVPCGTKLLYANKDPWSTFGRIVELGEGESSTPKCAAPTILYADGQITLSSTTEDATCYYDLRCPDAGGMKTSEDGAVDINGTYVIRAYAAADGYANSRTVTATLCFIGAAEYADGVDGTQARRGIVVAQSGTQLSASGLEAGEPVALYTLSGIMVSTSKADSQGTAKLDTGGAKGAAVLKAGNHAVKIVLE